MDYNIGRVLDAVAASPYTIVLLWSDLGYHQGEKRSFRKFSLWEEATRVPFIICDPRQADAPKGRICYEAVSLINNFKQKWDSINQKIDPSLDEDAYRLGQSGVKRPTAPRSTV